VSGGVQENVERAFGVLQAQFAIVRYPALTCFKDQMWEIMNPYVIIHNMIIESDREHPVLDTKTYHRQGPLATVDHQVSATFATFLAMRQEIRVTNTHSQLQDDLWSICGCLKETPSFIICLLFIGSKLCFIYVYALSKLYFII
jgi:hypothetical protein